jgi:hypothetical protein
MKSKKNIIEISEKEIPSEEPHASSERLVGGKSSNEPVKQASEPEPEPEPTKPKKILTDAQLEALAKAREKAKQRKKELAELNAKSKGLKEQKLKADAAEFDKLQKQKELEETVKKIEVSNPPPPPEKKKKIKKIIYESENSEEDTEEVIIKKKKQPKQPSYSQLADMSLEQQIKNKLQQEKITCFFNQLTNKKY